MDQEGSAAMLTSKQSAGVAQEVNLRITQARKYMQKGSTLALKPRTDVTRRSKTGVSVAPQKDLCPLKFKKSMFQIQFIQLLWILLSQSG